MSMNFGRELSLLRIRFTEAGSEELAAQQKAATGGDERKYLGADAAEIKTAADELIATYPEMGRAQMTAFVRTLWQSNTHEMQVVGSRILGERAALLEPADLPFVEGLIKKCNDDAIAATLSGDVLGTLAAKNKKVWRDLKRMAATSDTNLQRAAVRACRIPVLADETVFERCTAIIEPMFESGDDELLMAVDQMLGAVAAEHTEAVQQLAERHGRTIKVPKARMAAAKPATAAGEDAAPKTAKKKSKKAAKPGKKASKKT